jgi:hypothetical protein
MYRIDAIGEIEPPRMSPEKSNKPRITLKIIFLFKLAIEFNAEAIPYIVQIISKGIKINGMTAHPAIRRIDITMLPIISGKPPSEIM